MKWEGLHLVTQCVAGKCQEPKPHMMIRAHNKSNLEKLFSDWRTTLIKESNCSGNDYSEKIYSSQYWTLFNNLQSEISLNHIPSPKRYTVSAGYGLIEDSTHINPYHATFSQGQPDSIRTINGASAKEDCQRWWKYLSEDKALKTKFSPRSLNKASDKSILSLIEAISPVDVIIFFLSPAYMTTLEEDICQNNILWTYDNLFFISSTELKDNDPRKPRTVKIGEIDTEALRKREKYAVNNTTLPIKFVEYLFKTLGLDGFSMENILEQQKKLRGKIKAKKFTHRQPMTDTQVCSFIEKELKVKDYKGYTPLLRKLRDSGYQCEMNRFNGLFKEIKNGN